LKYLPLEALSEFLEVKDAIFIFVKLCNQGNNIFLEVLVATSTPLDLGNDWAKCSLRENIRVVLHIFLGVFISLQQLELEAAKEDSVTEQKVTLKIIVRADGVAVLLALHEFTTNAARVLVTDLIDLDCVVTAVERDNEATWLIIGLSWDEFCLETENVHILLEHLLHINLGWLRLERVDWSEWVLLSTISIVGRHSLIHDVGASLLQGNGVHGDAKDLLEPFASEGIAVVDHAVAAENVHTTSNSQVSWLIVLFWAQWHARIVSKKRLLCELLAFKKHGEGNLTIVRLIDLLNLDWTVREEEVENEEFVTAIVWSVLPENVEWENASVVLEETVKILVGSSTLKHDLDIVLVLSKIGRVLLHADHGAGLNERIIRIALWWVESDAFVLEESLGEIICIHDTENSAIYIKVDTDIQIFPGINLGLLSRDEYLVSLEEDALRDTTVLNSILKDVKSIVVQVVVHGALADAIVLVGVFNYGLLEVCLEVKDLL
jgi:hypothetical protein